LKISVNSTFSYIKFNVNYGSALQCYALQKYLKKRGHDVTLLRDYRANPVPILKRLSYLKTGKLFFKKLVSLKKMQDFIKDNISLSSRGYVSYSQLVTHCPDADCHIVGSDQIWHDAKNFRYLTYVPDDKMKLSYAASFGMTKIGDQMGKTIQPYLSRFDKIAVRENSGVEIVNSLGYDATHVLDPTLLLDYSEYPYKKDVTDLVGKNEFVYCYFLNLRETKDIHLEAIQQYVAENDKKLFVTAPLNYDMFDNEKGLLFPGVDEWLGLYHAANCIFTNTYHGLLFCIIFKKQFVFFCNPHSQGVERFTSVLDMIGLSDRMLGPSDVNRISEIMEQKIDYEVVYEKIRNQRLITDNYFAEVGI